MGKHPRKLRRRLAGLLPPDRNIGERLTVVERRMRANSRAIAQLRFAIALSPTDPARVLEHLPRSKSQHRQDIFVLLQLGFKRNGYFVDFGATDGIKLSNSYLLERDYGWTGIAAEPAKCWHQDLNRNRNCHVDTACVWSESGSIVTFNETSAPVLSTIDSFSGCDRHARARAHGRHYDVETLSLLDLLRKYDAPRTIDHLSIDTEGGEYEILRHFDFRAYRFGIITCEHNRAEMRPKLHGLLTSNGYERRFEALSACDDWYVDISGRPGGF
jgi:FkbM family methyltransferase